MRVRRVIFAIVGIALLVTIITPAAVSADTIDKIIVPGLPPGERISEAPVSSFEIKQADAVLSNVPAFDWCYGCSATSAAMMFGYYDRTGYSNMYAGPTNGGVCPLDNSDWGPGECSLSATHQGYDGLAVKGHVDDYWSAFGSTVDPYDGNWAEHGYADCTADFMGTNQYVNWQNSDGATSFYYWPNGDPLYDYSGCEPGDRDGCHGIRLFVESRGYNVIQNYNQRIDENVTGGFTYANFKAEIDAGRPVIIQVTDHSMLGYGYDDPDTIYIHDTWDHSDHSMTWGGTYSGLEHYGVTVIAVTVTATPSIDLSPSSYGFGDRQVGQCSPDYSFTLTNTGGSTATGSVSLTGTHATQFTITQGSGSFSLGTGASKTIKVKFCPTSTGAKSATLFADGTNCNDDSSSLSGTGVDNTELSYSPASHDFGDKCEGETDSTTFELWNSGTGTLTYSLSESCGWVDVNPTSGSSTGEHDTITVDIDTTGLSEGTHTCDITISSNGGSGTFTVTVNVVPCEEPVLSYLPTSHDFGDMCEGVTDSTTFELWNSGTGTLTYTLSESCGWVDVNPASGSSTGEHDTIMVDIDTTGLAEGAHTCDISIGSNDGSGTFTVTVNVVQCPETEVSIEDASAPQGGTVTVPINIAGVENMCGANIWLNYEKDVVIVDSVSDGDLVPLTHNIDNTAGVTKMNWDTTSGMTGDFVFAYVRLEAVGNPGDTSLLDIDVKELYDCVPPFNEIPRTVADGTFTIPSECGNMNVNPTSWSPTINCGESDSQIVTVSASGGMIRGVTVSKVSVPAWLSLSPTNLGDIASGSSKTFTITASPTASLSSGTRGDFAYTVRVSNTCGSPPTRDVSGSIHVDCIEPSQPPSYSNPSVSPGFGTPSTQFDYSVDVSDPEGDTVTVTLKTYDPSDGSWEDQGNRNVIGSGTVSWNDLTPFEANDKGKTAKYTFVFDDGNNIGEWGPFNGPAIETDACFSNWDYPSTSMAAEKIPVEVDISNPHGVKSAWLHYDYGDDGSEDGVTQMSLISVRGAKPEIRGGSSSGLGVKAQKIAVSESAPLSGGGGFGVAEREGIQKSIYLYDAKTCKDVEDSDPIGVTTVFSPTDSVSWTWLQFNDVWSSHTVKWDWYAPNGNFYADCTLLIPDPSDSGQDHWDWYKCWAGIYIDGTPAAEEEGIWTVKVYLDGGQIETLYFNIEYIISDYTMCKNVQASSPSDPIERTSTFLADEEKAVSWLRLDDVTNSLNVRWDWYDPSGNSYGTADTDTSEPEEGCYWDRVKAWCYIYIKDHAAAEKPGEWVVKVYIDGEYKFEEEFTIYPDDARYKCEIPAPGMGYVGDEVSFYVSAYSAYDSPTDSAKHLVDIYVPDDPTLSFSPSSHDFGDKCEGEMDSTTFEVWNFGTGTLTYSLSETCGWVEVNPTSGSSTGEHDTIMVDIDTTGLSEGTHTCDISINSNDGTGTSTVTVNVVPCPESSWTYMVYLDGDNNLEGAGIDDFLEMSSVGSTSNVNIVVQFDRIPGYSSAYDDWTTCKRFHVTSGMTPTPANALMDLGECNMGDPNTLDAFVTWTMTEFPADNYALILWNHGGGWKSINKWVPWADDIKDAKDAGFTRGICWDDTNNDYLSLQETEQALTGKYVQLLGYDACLMHMIEVVYQVRTHAAISVGSEEVEPWDGWPYDTILTDLTGTPSMSPSILGETIVSRYIESYAYATYETQSAVDKAKVSNLASAVDTLAQVLIDKLPDDYAKIQQARNGVEEFLNPDFIDLYHLAELIKLYLSDNPAAVAAAQAVMNNVDNTVTAEGHGTAHPNAHGLSIYFPEAEWAYLSSYENTKFAVDTHWDEFLKEYYAPSKPDLIITDKWVCWPDNCTICYNVRNIGTGTAPACHNTALYVDGVEVAHDHVPVDLAPGESYTGCFDGYDWTYTPPSDEIRVCADNNETLDEFDEDNNCLTNIWMCGDVNGDGKVTMSDVRKVFNRYLDPNYPLDSPWAADVNCDGKVTMSDVRKVFNRYLDPGYELDCCCEVV